MYKLIALDLDGTLLTDEKEIRKEDIDFLNQIRSIGYEIVIATGRGYYSAKKLTKDLIKPLIYISNNGNVVRDSDGDKDIAINVIEGEEYRSILKEGQARKLLPIIHVDYYHSGYDIIVDSETIKNKDYKSYIKSNYRYKLVESLEEEIGRILSIVYPGSHKDLVSFNKHILENYPSKFETLIMENVDQAEGLFEIMPPLASKWNGIMEYAKIKDIDRSQIIAIGDDNNDLDMIVGAGLGIAMKNASSLLKSSSDRISEKDNNSFGVSHELEKILRL